MKLKKIFNFLINRPIIVVFVLIIIFYVPSISVMQAQSVEKLIVRIIGIDKAGTDYEVTLLYFQPSTVQAFNDNFKTISVKDKTITEALNKAADYTGKEIGLSHLSDVIVSNEVAENDFINSIDHLIRRFSVSNSTNVVNCLGSAKEFLTTTMKLQSSSTREAEIIEHNNNYVVGERSDLELVVKSVYAPCKTTFIDIVKLSEDEGVSVESEQTSGSSQGSQSTGQEGGNSSKGENKKLVNDGSVAVIRNGKKIGELTREEVASWNTINGKSKYNKLRIENYSDENMQDATVVINVIDKKVKEEVYFDDNIPTICFNVEIQGNIFEILEEETSVKAYLSNKPLLNKKMAHAFIGQIKTDFYKTYLKLQSLNADPNNFYDLFNKQYHNKFQEFLKTLENKEDYIKKVKVVLNIEIEDR